jgi:N-acetylmuramoyl-L-alanine amidase
MNIQRHFLTRNIFSRPGKPLSGVKGAVIRWAANAGSSALANRNYFESLKNQSLHDPKARYASAHFIVGLGGEIIQRVPADETARRAGAKTYRPEALTAFGHYPNGRALGIELCHPDASGKFAAATPDAAAELCRVLCAKCGRATKSPENPARNGLSNIRRSFRISCQRRRRRVRGKVMEIKMKTLSNLSGALALLIALASFILKRAGAVSISVTDAAIAGGFCKAAFLPAGASIRINNVFGSKNAGGVALRDESNA